MTIAEYEVTIEYRRREQYTTKVYATSADQAGEISLFKMSRELRMENISDTKVSDVQYLSK